MKNITWIVLFFVMLCGCQRQSGKHVQTINWELRTASIDSRLYFKGRTYLPVYSQIYQMHENKTYDLTVTVSIRNTSPSDTIYLQQADYYGTNGQIVRHYLKHTVYLKPLETVEIVIYEKDKAGGTGGNFLFDWATKKESAGPLTEAVMISTSGQQGLSFLTRGVPVERP